MPRTKKESLVITTSGKRPLDEVVSDLRNAGFDVEQVLDAINVVTGKAPSDKRDQLRSVADVADVSEDFPVSIGPPDAPIS